MQGAPMLERRWARRAAWGLLAAILATSLVYSVHPWYDPTNDGSMYIAAARSLAAGEGYTYLGIPFVIRPPGFPWLLAQLVAWRGTDFYAFNLAVSVSGAVGILAFHFLLRARLGLVLATLVPLVLWFNPGYQRLCNQVMSDVPGWTLLVACLGLARCVGRERARGAFVLGAAIGLSSLVRSGNLLLVPAWLVAEALGTWRGARATWRTSAQRGGALALGAVLVLAPWSLRNRLVAPPPPADQTLLYSYSTGMWHTDMGDPRSPRVSLTEVLGRFAEQVPKSLHTLGTRLREGAPTPWTPVVAGVLLVALVAGALRRRAPEEWFALGTLLIVAFYFGYAGRLLVPVFALALVAMVELLRDGVARFAGARAGTTLAAAVCVGWLALDWAPRDGWREIEDLHRAHASFAREVQARLAPDARLGAWRGWHESVYLERPVYSFEQACERAGSPGDGAAIEGLIAKYRLDTVLLSELGLPASVQRSERDFAAFVAEHYGGPKRGLVRVR